VRLNRTPIRSPARSVANLEFHHVADATNDIARRLVTELERRGVRARWRWTASPAGSGSCRTSS
jgi:hypothetical protein